MEALAWFQASKSASFRRLRHLFSQGMNSLPFSRLSSGSGCLRISLRQISQLGLVQAYWWALAKKLIASCLPESSISTKMRLFRIGSVMLSSICAERETTLTSTGRSTSLKISRSSLQSHHNCQIVRSSLEPNPLPQSSTVRSKKATHQSTSSEQRRSVQSRIVFELTID